MSKLTNLTALLIGGSIALLPLDSLIEQLIGVAIAFLIISGASFLVNQHKSAK